MTHPNTFQPSPTTATGTTPAAVVQPLATESIQPETASSSHSAAANVDNSQQQPLQQPLAQDVDISQQQQPQQPTAPAAPAPSGAYNPRQAAFIAPSVVNNNVPRGSTIGRTPPPAAPGALRSRLLDLQQQQQQNPDHQSDHDANNS